MHNGVEVFPRFTEDDSAILSAICQALVPHLEAHLNQERRIESIARMTHELNMPVNTLRAAADRLQREVKKIPVKR